MTEDPWARAIPEKYIPGQIIKGVVTKLTNFGVFVELEPELEGLLHISELADHKIDKPQDIVKLGQEIEVKILRVDTEARKIGLSLRRAMWAAEEQEAKGPEQAAGAIKAEAGDTEKPKETGPSKKAEPEQAEQGAQTEQQGNGIAEEKAGSDSDER